MSVERHGYIAYSHGCRCDECRAAKAAYSSERRATARQRAQEHGDPLAGRYLFVSGITHGRSGYDEHGCRCPECVRAGLLAKYDPARHQQWLNRRTSVDGRLVATFLRDDQHGKRRAYSYYGCRCSKCVEAARLYSQKRRQRRPPEPEQGDT